MEYYKKIWYSKDEKKIKENELLVMLDLNEGELKKMPKSDKISEKYVESVTILNNDPFFQEYMSQEEDQRKMQNSLIREAEDSGYEKGIKLGEEKGKIDIVKSLIQSGMSLEEISKHTKIDIEKLKKILQNDKISKNM